MTPKSKEKGQTFKDEISESFITIRNEYLEDTIDYVLVNIRRPGGTYCVKHHTDMDPNFYIGADIANNEAIIYLDTNKQFTKDVKDPLPEDFRVTIKLDDKPTQAVLGKLPQNELVEYVPEYKFYIPKMKERIVPALKSEQGEQISAYQVRKMGNLGASMVENACFVYSACLLNKLTALDLRLLFHLKLLNDERITKNFLTAFQNRNLGWSNRLYSTEFTITDLHKGSKNSAQESIKKTKNEFKTEFGKVPKDYYETLLPLFAFPEFKTLARNLTVAAMNKKDAESFQKMNEIDSLLVIHTLHDDAKGDYDVSERLKNYILLGLSAEVSVLLEKNKPVPYERHTIFKIKELLEKQDMILEINGKDEFLRSIDSEEGLSGSRETLR